jgi:WD40 repeat protein/serine/threonine protein kinase
MTEREIFLEALDRDPAERAAFLDEACGGDATLRRSVESLLRLSEKTHGFLDVPAVAQLTPAAADSDTLQACSAGPVSLPFLSPSQRPDSLGRLGHYEVLEVVGTGGTGVVLRAFDDKLHRVVAIKVLFPQLASSAAARQRFVREARAAAAVTHDNVIDIIDIHAVEDAGAVPYLVMQFIAGRTLQDKIDRTGFLPVTEVLRIGLQIAAGLAAAHAQGLVHRDVKPANILLENSVERVKITDFGLARTVDDASLTQSGFVAGTPTYMSPEQAHGHKVDHRSDLFSLGSVLYTLCAGHPPFRAETSMAVLMRVCEDTPRSLREVNAEVPDWLEAIIARLLAKAPEDRFQTAAEVADLLSRHLAHLQEPSDPRTSDKLETPARGSGFLSLALRACVVALLAVGLVAACWICWQLAQAKVPDGANGAQQAPPQKGPVSQPDEANGAQATPPPQPSPPSAPEPWTKLSSPLDARKRQATALPANVPPETLAVLGEPPVLRLPARTTSHWIAQTGDGQLLAVPSANENQQDGRWVGSDFQILLIEARTGKLFRTLTGHTGRAFRPTFSPDGKHLASGSENGILRVWTVETGKEEMTLNDPGPGVWAVAYDPEGKRLVSADAAGTVKVWDAQGRRLTSFAGHARGVNQIAFSPDGKRLATAALDGTCKLWDTDTWQEVRTLRGKCNTLESVAWSRDGKWLAAGDDAQVIVWNADTYAELHTLPTPGKGLLAFGPDDTLWTAAHDYTNGKRHAFTRWDVKTATQRHTCELFSSGGVAFFHLGTDGRTVYASHTLPVNTIVETLNAETGRFWSYPPRGHVGPISHLAFSPDGRTLVSGSQDQTVRLWDLSAWQSDQPQPPCRELWVGAAAVSLAFSPDGSLLATESFPNGALDLWETASGNKSRRLESQATGWSHLAFTPDGATVATGSEFRVNFWDVKTGKRDESPAWNDSLVLGVAFSSDGRLMAGADVRGIRVIDRKAGRRLYNYRDEKPFRHVKFSPDGKILAATADTIPPLLRLWDMTSGEELAGRAGHMLHIHDLCFHPSSRLVVTASWDLTVRLWDTSPLGKQVRAFDFRATPWSVAISPEGRYLAVGLHDGTIAILRLEP